MPFRDPSTIRLAQTSRAQNQVVRYSGGGNFTTTAATYAAGGATDSILPLPKSWINNFALSKSAADTVGIAVGECRGGTNADQNLVNLISTSAFTKDLSSDWVAGTGNGGLGANSGAVSWAANTWYHVFAIEDGSGTVDFGIDTALACTNLLAESSYTNFRRLGSVYADGTPDITNFFQVENDFYWVVPVLDFTDTTVSDAEEHTTLNTVRTGGGTPPDVRTKVLMNVMTDHTGTASYWVYDTTVTSDTPSATAAPGANIRASGTGGDIQGQQISVWTDTSQQIAYRSGATNADIWFVVQGWYDLRGRDA